MRLHTAGRFVATVWLVWLSGASVSASVVINEVHYHPPAPFGKALEFVELLNLADAPVALVGWRFTSGIDYAFPVEAVLPAGGYLVVCRNRAVFTETYGLHGRVSGGVFGNFAGALDDGGEELVLVDRFNAVIDAVRYDDEPPWPSHADGMGQGRGSSIQRVCPEAPSCRYDNWVGSPRERPTPLESNSRIGCPLPVPEVPRVVISEIHYHPADDNDAREEFVELYNTGDDGVSLADWKFGEGLDFTFPAGTVLGPGEYLAVCRDVGYIRDVFRAERAVGNFVGQLSNRGERLSLIDAEGDLVDAVFYRDQGDWHHHADGMGRSLEKVVLTGLSSDPANWSRSVPARNPDDPLGFLHVESVGAVRDLFSQKLVVGIDGPGEFIVDNLILEAVDNPGVPLNSNYDFERGLENWSPSQVNAPSAVEDGIGVGGSRALRLVSSGGCSLGCGSLESVVYDFTRGSIDPELEHRIALDIRYVAGSTNIYARMLQGVEVEFQRVAVTPGRANTVDTTDHEFAPPLISQRGRFPEEPRSTDAVGLSIRVRPAEGDSVDRVALNYLVMDPVDQEFEWTDANVTEMFDDGAHHDAFAGDGVYGAELPPFDHNSKIYYYFEVETVGGWRALSPVPLSPGGLDGGRFVDERLDGEFWGYYVNDNQPESVLPVYHLLIPGVTPASVEADPQALNDTAFLDWTLLRRASFAFRGELYPEIGMRWRGNTACYIQKRNFKLRFNPGRDFRGVRKVNLQGLWTDKALVREHLAWEFFREIGVPYCETEYIRVHVNGEYHGLFLYLEHPDQRFLRRLGLNEDGCLYKAKQPQSGANERPRGVAKQDSLLDYERYWEKETCKTEDLSSLGAFIDGMYATPTVEFMEERVFPEMLIGYQLGQVVLNNIDSFSKNHFLYSDPADGRWGMITWDMDLVFGKFFTRSAVQQPERPVGTLNDCMLSDLESDLDPWFTTRVNGNVLLHHFVDRFFLAGGPAEPGHYQRAYLVRLWDLLQEKYRNEVYDPILDDLVDFLADEAQSDVERWGRYPSNAPCNVPDDMAANVEIVKEQLALHRHEATTALIPYIQRRHADVMNHPRLKITEVMFNPEGDSADLEFVELLNTSGRTVILSGWRFGEGVGFAFPPGAAITADEIVVVARDPTVFAARYADANVRVFGPYSGRLANEGDVLRLYDNGPGHPATIDYLAYEDGGRWPDAPEGFSIELTQVHVDRDNDRPENWRLSDNVGGTPGVAAMLPHFVRGDIDESGAPTVTDVLLILGHLFLGQTAPSCLDAADVDDDGFVQINDSIYLVNFLFLGTAAIPAPYPESGFDATTDDLGCLVSTAR